MQSNDYGTAELIGSTSSSKRDEAHKIKFGHRLHPAILANIKLEEGERARQEGDELPLNGRQDNCNSIVINDQSNLGDQRSSWLLSANEECGCHARPASSVQLDWPPAPPFPAHSDQTTRKTTTTTMPVKWPHSLGGNEEKQLTRLRNEFEHFLNHEINLRDDDKLTLSIHLNEFETNSCDLSELLNNLLQNLISKMANPMSKYKLLSFIKAIYIEPLIEVPLALETDQLLATSNQANEPPDERKHSHVIPLNWSSKLQLDLRLFEAMIQRYLVASRVLQADESMLFNPIKSSCRPDDYYLPSSGPAIKLRSTTRETNNKQKRRHSGENLITLASARQTDNNNNNENENQPQLGRHLSGFLAQNVTPFARHRPPELPEFGTGAPGGRPPSRQWAEGAQGEPPPQQQQLARRNLSWLEARHDNHDHADHHRRPASSGQSADGLQLQSGPRDSPQANEDVIYLDDDDDDDHADDRHHQMIVQEANQRPNNNIDYQDLVSIKKREQADQNDRDYYILPIRPREQPPQELQFLSPDVPDMRGREQVNNNNNNNNHHHLNLNANNPNDNNQVALRDVVQAHQRRRHPGYQLAPRYQNNGVGGGGGGGGGDGQANLNNQPSNNNNNLHLNINHWPESTISRLDHFNGRPEVAHSRRSIEAGPPVSQRGHLRHLQPSPSPLSSSTSSSLLQLAHQRPCQPTRLPDDHHHNNHVHLNGAGPASLSSLDHHHHHHHHRPFAGPIELERARPPGHLDRSWASLESLGGPAAYQLAHDGINLGRLNEPRPRQLGQSIETGAFNQNNSVIYEPLLEGSLAPSGQPRTFQPQLQLQLQPQPQPQPQTRIRTNSSNEQPAMSSSCLFGVENYYYKTSGSSSSANSLEPGLQLQLGSRPTVAQGSPAWPAPRDDLEAACPCAQCRPPAWPAWSPARLGSDPDPAALRSQLTPFGGPSPAVGQPNWSAQQVLLQQQRCQSSMSAPANSANSFAGNRANWPIEPANHSLGNNNNIPSTATTAGAGPATYEGPALPFNWAQQTSHLLPNQQVVVARPASPASPVSPVSPVSPPVQAARQHRRHRSQQQQPHRWLSPSASQLRGYEQQQQQQHEQLGREQSRSKVRSHRKRHQRPQRQVNYVAREQHRLASDQETYLEDEYEDEEQEDDDDGLPSCVSLVPSEAKGRLPMSVAEQMSEQANNFILQHGSSSASSGPGACSSHTGGQRRRAASATGAHSQAARKPSLQVRRTLRVKIKKSKPILGIAIEGGFNVSGQLLPRIVCVHEEGAAYQCGKLRASDLILEINGVSTVNMTHDDIARTIASAYYQDERPYIEFLIGESVHV